MSITVGGLLAGLRDGVILFRAGKGVYQGVKWLLSKGLPKSRGRHLRELRARLGAMPFIYRDVEGLLISDYVPAALKPVDLVSLDFYKRQMPANEGARDERDQAKAIESLQHHTRALFLADAGMGKTTFLSHIAVALTFRRPLPVTRDLFRRARFGNEHPLPIFVPLKVLDNSLQRPIMAYIRGLPLFRGGSGFRRLIAEARRYGLLLLLDGYDEVYISDDSGSSIKREIDSLLTGVLEELPGDEDLIAELTTFYRLVRGNRIWLSSRREHYLANRLAADMEHSDRANAPPIAAVEILGLQSRLDLVKKIFDRYRAKSSVLVDELSEDAFFAYISRKLDDEMNGLSHNPLFLTVMCYLYVKGIEGGELSGPEGSLNLRSLVLTCTSLLLRDLDEFRVRQLPNKIRRALREKRGLYPERKFSFLCYFAARLLGDPVLAGRSAFTEEAITASARAFFSLEPIDDEAREILRNLDHKVIGNLVWQLVLQGVFVVVDNTGRETFYDFPHRRFREILAAEHFDSDDRFGEFLGNILRPHYREFVLVMFRLAEKRRNSIIVTILSRSSDLEGREYLLGLARACLEQRPKGYDPTKVIEDWIRRLADDGDFDLVELDIVKFMAPGAEFVVWVDRQFAKALVDYDSRVLYFWGSILYGIQPKLFINQAVEALRGDSSQSAKAAARLVLRINGDLFADELLKGNSRSKEFRQLVFALFSEKQLTGREPWFRRVCRDASDSKLATLLGHALRLQSPLTPRILGFQRRSEPLKMAELEIDSNGGGVFVVTDARSELMENAQGRKALMSMEEGLFSSLGFIDHVAKPSFGEVAGDLYDIWLHEQRGKIDSRLQNGFIDSGQAGLERERLRTVNVEDFIQSDAGRIHEERERRYRANLQSISDFARRELFWPSGRWLSFINAVKKAYARESLEVGSAKES